MSEKCTYIYINHDPDDDKFKTIDEFKWVMWQGGEVGFTWNGKGYFVSAAREENKIYISENCKQETECYYNNVEKLLDHVIDGKKLRQIIKDVEVTDRSF